MFREVTMIELKEVLRLWGKGRKTFLSHALGHIACRRGATVLALRTEQMLKTLKQARLDRSYEAELRKIISVDP